MATPRLLASLLVAASLLPGVTPTAAAGDSTLRLRRGGRLLRRIQPAQGAVEVPDCKCGCCAVTYRTPDEMEDSTVFLKCGLEQATSQDGISDGTSVESSTNRNG